MKQITGIILMVIETLLGIVICVGIAVAVNMNSDRVLKAAYKANYLNLTEQAVEETLKGYMTEDKVDEILDEVSVKSSVKELIVAMDNNTVEKKAEIMRGEINSKVINSLEDDIDESLKKEFANVVSNAYMKTIFPTKEMSMVSRIYTLYESKITLGIIVIAVIYGIIYVYLSKGRKMYKWQIISMYNTIVFVLAIYVLTSMVSGITIGNPRTANVIINMISKIRLDLLYTALGVAVLAIISNYFAYFKKTKKKIR